MTTYTAHCEWDTTGWWAVTVPEVPGALTQSRRLDQVPVDAAEAIELMTGETPDDYRLEIDWSVPGDAGKAAGDAHRLRREADDLAQRAGTATGEAVRALRDAGFSYRDIGRMVGVSYQRVAQLVNS
jgi:predicted RNase H-like HicB family nuclease